MKILITVLLSAALIWLTPAAPRHINKQSVRTVSLKSAKPIPAVPAKPEQAVTAAAPVATPAPQAQGCNAYKHLLAQYDWNTQVMAAVMQAESSCNPNAVSPVNYDGVRDYGIMQLHGQEIYDPATNIAHAYRLWTTQGYHAWSVFNSGKYLSYM